MISPCGLATRPRIPAIWRTWVQLPRAPELTIWLMAFSTGKFFCIASSILLVASVQISMSSVRRSMSVMSPRANKVQSQYDRGLVLRADDVGDRDRHPGAGGPAEAGLHQRVQARGDRDLRVTLG